MTCKGCLSADQGGGQAKPWMLPCSSSTTSNYREEAGPLFCKPGLQRALGSSDRVRSPCTAKVGPLPCLSWGQNEACAQWQPSTPGQAPQGRCGSPTEASQTLRGKLNCGASRCRDLTLRASLVFSWAWAMKWLSSVPRGQSMSQAAKSANVTCQASRPHDLSSGLLVSPLTPPPADQSKPQSATPAYL